MQGTIQNTSIIVAFIALAGTICAAILAASLQYVYSVRTAKKQRQQEKANITRALLTEIAHLNDSVKRHSEWWEKSKQETKLQPLIAFATPMFDELREKIGQVDQAVAPKIVRYYGYIFFINKLQESLAIYEQRQITASFIPLYTTVLNRHISERSDDHFDAEYKKYGLKDVGNS